MWIPFFLHVSKTNGQEQQQQTPIPKQNSRIFWIGFSYLNINLLLLITLLLLQTGEGLWQVLWHTHTSPIQLSSHKGHLHGHYIAFSQAAKFTPDANLTDTESYLLPI